MIDIATFFYPRNQQDVVAVVIPLPPTGTIIVCGKGATSVPDPSPEEPLAAYQSRLKEAMKQGGLVLVWDGTVPCKVDLIVIENPSYSPPAEVLRMRVFGSPKWLKAKNCTIELSAGEHLLIPANQACYNQLQEFFKQLEYLPVDYTTSFLNLIRRPSLEWRIARLERRLPSAPPPQLITPVAEAGESNKTEERKPPGWWKRSYDIPLFIIVPYAALLLMLMGLTAWSLLLPRTAAAPRVARQAEAAPVDRTERQEATGSLYPHEAELAVVDLLEAMKTSRQPGVRTLYEHHDLEHPADRRSRRKLALAMVKLVLLNKQKLQTDDADLTAPDHLEKTRQTLDSTDQGGLAPKGRQMLGYLTCEAFQRPGLPPMGTDPESPIYEVQCGQTDPQQVIEAIKYYTTWAKAAPQGRK